MTNSTHKQEGRALTVHIYILHINYRLLNVNKTKYDFSVIAYYMNLSFPTVGLITGNIYIQMALNISENAFAVSVGGSKCMHYPVTGS